MPAKKRRVQQSGQVVSKSGSYAISAIAAARLQLEAAARGNIITEVQNSATTWPLQPSIDSSESELEGSDVDENQSSTTGRDYELCNWHTHRGKIHVDNDGELIIDLPKHSTISLIGYFDLTVYKGAININGANLSSRRGDEAIGKVHRFFAAATHPIYQIRGLDTVSHIRFASCLETAAAPCSSPLFANIWNARPEGSNSRSFDVILRSSHDPMKRPLIPDLVSEEWCRAVENCAASPSITVVIGPTGAGKSTFARRLLNRYLTGSGKSSRPQPVVYYLDLDQVNPEYTPHGQITLIAAKALSVGPNFIHPTAASLHSREGNHMLHAHPIPLDVTDYQEHYLACCRHLMTLCRNLRLVQPPSPVIVNTPGWLYDIESETCTQLLAEIKPQEVVTIGNEPPLDVPANLAVLCGTVRRLSSHQPLMTSLRSHADLRSMCMQSYFHPPTYKTKLEGSPAYIWNSLPFSRIAPWEFCYQETSELQQDFLGFAMFSEHLNPASLPHALNGSIVQVVQLDSSLFSPSHPVISRTSHSGIPYLSTSTSTIDLTALFDPRSTNLICTALVRGFDTTRKIVQLLVPRTHDVHLYGISPDRTMLVGGCCEAPEWAFVEETSTGKQSPGHGKAPTGSKSVPWVVDTGAFEIRGHLNAMRRVRKHQIK